MNGGKERADKQWEARHQENVHDLNKPKKEQKNFKECIFE